MSESIQHSTQEIREHAEWLLSDQNVHGVTADEELLCEMALGLLGQLEAAQTEVERLRRCLAEEQTMGSNGLDRESELRTALREAADANPWTHAQDIAQQGCRRLGVPFDDSLRIAREAKYGASIPASRGVGAPPVQ